MSYWCYGSYMLTPYVTKKNLLDDVDVLACLAEIHGAACGKRDFVLCERIRLAIEGHLTERTGWIKIESGLNLSPAMDF